MQIKGEGSSPRMRGTPRTWRTTGTRAWDHPRACGEHSSAYWIVMLESGSSPRMRGTHERTGFLRPCHGIIPAHAGNTPARTQPTTRRRDHPRACGEHPICLSKSSSVLGSSPRMRGTPVPGFESVMHGGIIPAHAGNTSFRWFRWFRDGDHPRACGEHVSLWTGRYGYRGSSPRMRGTLHDPRPDPVADGIIPAHAGNTSTAMSKAR